MRVQKIARKVCDNLFKKNIRNKIFVYYICNTLYYVIVITFILLSDYIYRIATVDTRHRSRCVVFAKKVAALSLPLRHSTWWAAERAALYIILLHH